MQRTPQLLSPLVATIVPALPSRLPTSFSLPQVCRKKKVWFHTDAAQAAGKVPVDVNKIGCDLMSLRCAAATRWPPAGVWFASAALD